MIQRLVEADEQSTQEDPPNIEEKPKLPKSNDVEASAPPPADSHEQQQVSEIVTEKVDNTLPPSDDSPKAEPQTNGESLSDPKAVDAQLDGARKDGFDNVSQAETADVPAQTEAAHEDALAVTPSSGTIQAESEIEATTITNPDPAKPSQDAMEITVSRQDSLNGEEALEDLKKRKRRSTTPTLSSESVQKKAKLEDARPHVKLPEDASMEDVDAPPKPNAPAEDPSQAQEPSEPENVVVEDAPAIKEVKPNGESRVPETPAENEATTEDAAQVVDDLPKEPNKGPRPQTPEPEAPTPVVEISTAPAESPAKRSPSDARFKNILPPPSQRATSPPPTTGPLDRTVTPALHPATTALYIRNILRPLHIENLRDHLLSLATASSTSPDPDTITTFHLDSIRTHALVRFSSVAAASRVRTGLHDRVWPDEKNRKPLWVDFVPEEKLEKWIEVENDASSGGGRGARGSKRWEVVYEDKEDGVKAYLQEVGSSSGGVNRNAQPPPSRPTEGGGAGVRGAPSGPRVRDTREQQLKSGPPPLPQTDKGRGFQALDDLFRSTTAKPKLYYLPVPKRTADKRLDMLAEGRGGGRGGDEMRRYTFEEGALVDRGPEFGMRGRGGGGYRGRGGGSRGDYRGDHRGGDRGDYRRDRR